MIWWLDITIIQKELPLNDFFTFKSDFDLTIVVSKLLACILISALFNVLD